MIMKDHQQQLALHCLVSNFTTSEWQKINCWILTLLCVFQDIEQKKRDYKDLQLENEFYKAQLEQRDQLIQVSMMPS